MRMGGRLGGLCGDGWRRTRLSPVARRSRAELSAIEGGNDVLLKNELTFYHVLGRLIFEVALAPDEAPVAGRSGFVTARRFG